MTTRCASDLTPEEWAVVRPLLPDRNRLGWPRQVKLRRVRDAIQHSAAARLAAAWYVQSTGGGIDSPSVKNFENTTLSGFDAGKGIKGRKRDIITDTSHPT